MKANKAPEKLYLDATSKCGDTVFTIKNNDTDIEYTRTDAFVKRACDWFRTHSEADYFELIPDANYCGAGNLNKKRMIEDFEEYLKK